MRKPVAIDSHHSRAIVNKIGEQLRGALKEDRELPANFQEQIERLRQSEIERISVGRSRKVPSGRKKIIAW
jgi:hypothetical protein